MKIWRASTLLVSLLALAHGCNAPRPLPGKLARPHLVVVCIDTLRADHVGVMGYHRDTTPSIDAFASRGVVFDDALATSNWTVPSVASLFTSLPPDRHGAGISGDTRRLNESEPPHQVPSTIPMLAELLRKSGYRTGMFAANPFLYGRFKDGFESAFVERVDAHAIVNAAISWLDLLDSRPAFVYAHFIDAHQPNLPPEPYFQYFQASDGDPHELAHSDWQFGQVENLDDEGFKRFLEHRIGVYDGAVRFLDSELARLFATLDGPRFLNRTVVVVTADHGEEFWDHAIEQAVLRDDPRGIWGIGHGHTMYQELLRVPLIVGGPGFTAGSRSPCPVSLLDIAPTLLARAGLAPLPQHRGLDLMSLVDDTSHEPCEDRPRIASSPAYGRDSFALVQSGLKLIQAHGRKPLMFDLRSDPGESRDLSATEPSRFRQLLKIARTLDREHRAVGAPAPEEEGLATELRALGYL